MGTVQACITVTKGSLLPFALLHMRVCCSSPCSEVGKVLR